MLVAYPAPNKHKKNCLRLSRVHLRQPNNRRKWDTIKLCHTLKKKVKKSIENTAATRPS